MISINKIWSTVKPIAKKTFFVVLWISIALSILFFSILLIIKTRWAQQKIVTAATQYVTSKTGTVITLDRLFITFSGNIQLEGLYAEDLKKDTLLYSRSLEANISFLPLLNNTLVLQNIEWDGVTANIKRSADSTFNFDFFIKAFASDKKVSQPVDSTSKAFTINIGTIHLSNIQGVYNDDVIKLKTNLALGDLLLDVKNFDLENMNFDVRTLALKNTKVYVRKDPVVGDIPEDTTTSILPHFQLEHLLLENVHALYESPFDSVFVQGNIANFIVNKSELDLNKQSLDLGKTQLANSTIVLRFPQNANATTRTDTISNAFQWPNWSVTASDLVLNKTNISFDIGSQKAKSQQFDPNHIALTALNLQLSNAYLKKESLGLSLANLSFLERSGFRLSKLGFTLALDTANIDLKAFQVQTEHSFLKGAIKTTYKDLYAFLDRPALANFDLKVFQSSLSFQDVYVFLPELKKDTLLQKIDQYPLHLSTHIKGKLDAMAVQSLNASWAKGTQVSLAGIVTGLPNIDSLHVDIPTLKFITVKQDALNFVEESETLQLPAFIGMKASVKGSLKDSHVSSIFSLPHGQISVVTNYNKNKQTLFNGVIKISDLDVSKILTSVPVKRVSTDFTFTGSGDSLANLSASFQSIFSSLEINNYNYKGLSIEGNLKEKIVNAHIAYLDTNANVVANTRINIDNSNPSYSFDLDLKGADFFALGYTTKNLKGKFKVHADFTGNPEHFAAQLNVNDGLFIHNGERLLLGPFNASAEADSVHTKMSVNSDFLTLNANANSDLITLIDALKEHINSYFETSKEKRNDSLIVGQINAQAHIGIRSTPLLRELIVPDLKQMDSIRLDMIFKQDEKYLALELLAPQIQYNTSSLNNFKLNLNTSEDALLFNTSFDSLKAGPATIYKTNLTGNFKQDKLTSKLAINNKQDSALIVFAGYTLFKEDSSISEVDAGELIFNSNAWTIPEKNSVLITKNKIQFQNFSFTNQEQKVYFSSYPQELDRFKVALDNFQLSTLTSLVNAEKIPVEGTVKGFVDFRNVFTTFGYDADIAIASFKVMNESLGMLKLKSTHVNEDQYDVALSVKEGKVDLNLNGQYLPSATNPQLDVTLGIEKVDLSFIESFTDSLLENSKGSLQADLRIKGNPMSPDYKGSMSFRGASFKVAPINAGFKFSDETIRVDNDGVYFNNFSLQDEKGNSSTLNGMVGTTKMQNPTFDLRLISKDFQLINSTREDNDLYYGTVLMNVDMKVKGDLKEPHVDIKTRLNKGTSLNFIVPESKLEVVNREGVVVFENVKKPDDPLTKNQPTEKQSLITGLQLRALIEVDPSTSFKIIMDERAGDFLEVKGEANLTFDIDPNGRMSMSGGYDVKEGEYEVSLYGVVKRKFKITPGGTITWSGNAPTNANIDISASYAVKTSAYDLMSQQLSGADQTTQNRYRQVLPFNVLINIKGNLLNPQIGFAVDMPDKERGALGGNVYARIQQLNQDENELNTQVFALLVMNRFIPAGSGGAGSGSVAKSSVSKILSGQLNNLSEKYVKFVDLNVDVNSYTDYQSGIAKDRSDLNLNVQKKLFNDRVVVKVGSQVAIEGQQEARPGENSNNVLGDASLEYLLTADGRYLITGFRKNEYGGVVDGQLVVTGISLVLNKEFNSFQEIWKRTPEEKQAQKEQQDKKKKKSVK